MDKKLNAAWWKYKNEYANIRLLAKRVWNVKILIVHARKSILIANQGLNSGIQLQYRNSGFEQSKSLFFGNSIGESDGFSSQWIRHKKINWTIWIPLGFGIEIEIRCRIRAQTFVHASDVSKQRYQTRTRTIPFECWTMPKHFPNYHSVLSLLLLLILLNFSSIVEQNKHGRYGSGVHLPPFNQLISKYWICRNYGKNSIINILSFRFVSCHKLIEHHNFRKMLLSVPIHQYAHSSLKTN